MLPDTLVLASHNAGKLKEISEILAPFKVKIKLLSDFTSEDPVEDGLSFVENALIKARFASKISGLPAIADDSGLCVKALGGAPGIYSARFSGTRNDEDNNALLLEKLHGLKTPGEREACYRCAMVYVDKGDDPTPDICQASWKGSIGFEPRGSGGFGYDPLFVVQGRGQTAAQLPPEVKNLMSHRGKALKLLCCALQKRYA